MRRGRARARPRRLLRGASRRLAARGRCATALAIAAARARASPRLLRRSRAAAAPAVDRGAAVGLPHNRVPSACEPLAAARRRVGVEASGLEPVERASPAPAQGPQAARAAKRAAVARPTGSAHFVQGAVTQSNTRPARTDRAPPRGGVLGATGGASPRARSSWRADTADRASGVRRRRSPRRRRGRLAAGASARRSLDDGGARAQISTTVNS